MPAIAPAPAPAAKPLEVISWLREPKLPGGAGQKVYSEWILHASTGNETTNPSLEVHHDRHVSPLGEVSQQYRFTTMIPEKARPQAVADAVDAIKQIAASPEVAKLKEVPSDGFFFGDLVDDGTPFGNQTPDIAVGQGKLLVRGADGQTHYYVGDLKQMHDIVDVTKSTVRGILKAK